MRELTFDYRGTAYPSFIREGHHAQYIEPVARKLCVGHGVDVGANRDDWALPGATMVDLTQPAPFNDAMRLPFEDASLDYVFSSHCLEHLADLAAALREWTRVLRPGGVMLLYLPHWDCEYWRVGNNPKHLHNLDAGQIRYLLELLGYGPVFTTGVDLAYSFAAVGIRGGQSTR